MPSCCYDEGTCKCEEYLIDWWLNETDVNADARYSAIDIKAVLYNIMTEAQGNECGFRNLSDTHVLEKIREQLLQRVSDAKKGYVEQICERLNDSYLSSCDPEDDDDIDLNEIIESNVEMFLENNQDATYTTIFREDYSKIFMADIRKEIAVSVFKEISLDHNFPISICEHYANKDEIHREEIVDIIKLFIFRPNVTESVFFIISAYVCEFEFD